MTFELWCAFVLEPLFLSLVYMCVFVSKKKKKKRKEIKQILSENLPIQSKYNKNLISEGGTSKSIKSSCCKKIYTLVSFPEAMLNLYSWNHNPSKFLQSEMRVEWAMFTREGLDTHSTTTFASSSTSIFLAII